MSIGQYIKLFLIKLVDRYPHFLYLLTPSSNKLYYLVQDVGKEGDVNYFKLINVYVICKDMDINYFSINPYDDKFFLPNNHRISFIVKKECEDYSDYNEIDYNKIVKYMQTRATFL